MKSENNNKGLSRTLLKIIFFLSAVAVCFQILVYPFSSLFGGRESGGGRIYEAKYIYHNVEEVEQEDLGHMKPKQVHYEEEGGILVMTCCRPKVYQETLNSLSEVREKGNFTLIASHDFFDKESVDVTDSITGWKRVVRVVNPYRPIYDEFFDKKTTVEYGTKALKCHWAWAMKFCFDIMNLPYVIYIEDDFAASPDVLIAFREFHQNRHKLCESESGPTKGMVCSMNLGCRLDCYKTRTTSEYEKVVFFPGPGNTGAVFYKEHWDSIRDHISDYCGNVEDNWDITMAHMVAKGYLPKDTLTYSYSRVLDMPKVGSVRTKSSPADKAGPRETRERMMRKWRDAGMDSYRVDLSSLERKDIRRVGPVWNKPFRTCKREYTDLCVLMSTQNISVKSWSVVNENIYVPEFDFVVDKSTLEHDKDLCWPKK